MNMKKIIFSLAISLMFSACATQQNFTASDKSQSIILLDKIMNECHHAGAVADDGVYLGTDETERWTKPQFVEWGMKYFTTRDTAWDFTPYNRIWAFSEDGKTAWFDELLKMHMGVCRGSGVLLKTGDDWKIKQYNLAVAVPNDKMNEYRKIVGIGK